MSTNLALNSALTGLLASQQALNVISNNLANINTPNYAKKQVNLEENVVAGSGGGVQVASITGVIDQMLNNSLNEATGTLQSLSAIQSYTTQVQNAFGNVGSGSSISDLLQSLDNAFNTVANNPGGTPSSAVQALTNVTTSLQSTSTSLQALRAKADAQVAQDVHTVNATLQNIASVNQQLAASQAAGTDPSFLQDQLNGSLATLSKYMNIQTFTRPDGSVAVYTTQGVPLVDVQAQTVNFNPASQIQAQMSLAGGQLSGLTITGPNISGGGIDVTSQISSGEIAGLLQMRDTTLPNLQSQLDTLASALQTGLNQVSNAGVSFPNGGQSFTGQSVFLSPGSENISLASGDTMISLFNGQGQATATTSLSLMMKQYLQSTGLPTSNSWTVDQVAGGLNQFLNTQFGSTNVSYAKLLPTGQFSLQLPQTSKTTIGFQDMSTSTYQSTISANANTALGLTGPLTLSDTSGATFSVNVSSSDTLSNIQAKFAALTGVTANLVPNAAGTGDYLQVVNNAGLDMYVNPDTNGGNVEAGLGMLPAGTNTVTPDTFNVDQDNLSNTFTSNTYTNGASVPGVSGVLTFSDQSGQLAQITMNPAWNLNTIANNINSAANGKLNASVITKGNQVALQVVNVAGNQMSVNTTPYTQQSTVAFGAVPGNTLTATINGKTYTSNAESGSDTLASIAQQINSPLGPFAGSGLLATVDSTNTYISLVSTSGQAVSFGGSMASQLGLALNPATALGLQASPDTTVSGLANFLGLNDILVTNQPQTTYQSATLTTSFRTSQASNLQLSDGSFANGDPSTGAPQALNLSFAAGSSLQQIADQINQQALTYNTDALPIGNFSAKAGTLTILNQPFNLGSISISGGESLAQIAAGINGNSTMAAAGVQATVGTDGTEEWLQVYNQQGKPLQMAEVMSNGAAPQLAFSATQLANAAVIGDGSGQRLQITHSTDSTLQATGTLFPQTNMGPAALNTSAFLTVPAALQASPTLLPVGTIQFDPTANAFFVGDTANTNAQAMANFMASPRDLPSSGGLTQGNLTLSGYAADIVATASTAASNNNTQVQFQSQLVNNLSNQQGQVSGVNLDQELSNLLTYQQSYSAAARVISTMQQLFQVLNNIVQ